jgi:hypothetical protein
MYDSPKAGETRSPKNTHYVSLINGHVYPAMRNLPGYEDDNLADWRPASAAEIERFNAGDMKPARDPVGTVQLAAPLPVTATPSQLTLAPEDPVVDGAPQDPPPLPAGALGMVPPPAFKVD